jgi:hypothetical protein
MSRERHQHTGGEETEDREDPRRAQRWGCSAEVFGVTSLFAPRPLPTEAHAPGAAILLDFRPENNDETAPLTKHERASSRLISKESVFRSLISSSNAWGFD